MIHRMYLNTCPTSLYEITAVRVMRIMRQLKAYILHIIIPDDVLSTDWTFCHLLAAVGAGAHVPTLKHHAVDLKQ